MPPGTPSRLVVPLLVLAALSVLALVTSVPGTMPLSGQSPVSPVPATQPAPATQPLLPAQPAQPMPGQSTVSPATAIGLGWMLSEPFWVSPLPWVALGLILFSALAWALFSLLRRLDRDV